MSTDDVIQKVKTKLPTIDVVSAAYIQRLCSCIFPEAHRAIRQLQIEGLIGKEWSTGLGGYPVQRGNHDA